jgi:hypothetical protein
LQEIETGRAGCVRGRGMPQPDSGGCS